MNKAIIIIVGLILALALGLGGCFTISTPTPTPTPVPTPKPIPEYHTLSFTLQEEEEYSFPIYLRNNETLHLIWTAQDTKAVPSSPGVPPLRVQGMDVTVWFGIITPCGEVYGFYDHKGQYANGTLEARAARPMSQGTTRFSPSDYDWGEGYYIMSANKHDLWPVTVKVEYWIEE